MSYNPLLDPGVSVILTDDNSEPQILNDGGVALLLSASELSVAKIKNVVDCVAGIDVLFNGSASEALISRGIVNDKLKELFRAYPVGLVVDVENLENIEPLLFVAHGVFSRITFIVMAEEIPKISGKCYQVVTTINSLAHNMIKHFGYKTLFTIKILCSKVSKEYRQIQKKTSLLREDNRLIEVVIEQKITTKELEHEIETDDSDVKG